MTPQKTPPRLRALRWLPLLVLAAGCAGTPQTDAGMPVNIRNFSPQQVDSMLARAESDLGNRRLTDAQSGYSAILKAEPGNTRARIGLGEVYLAMGNGEVALKTFEALPPEQADQPVVLQGRGIALVLTGRDVEAESILSRAVAADPSLWRAWNALGRLYDKRMEWTQADSSYQQGLAANPTAAEIHNNLGYSQLLRGRHADAVASFQRALQLSPGLAAAQDNLALANALMGQYDRALTAIPAARMPVAMNNVGFAALMRKDYSTAETFLNRAVQESSTHFGKAHENLRWLAYLRGNGAGVGR